MQLPAAFVSLLAFSGLAVAQQHRYCACQSGTDNSIHESATQRVLDMNPTLYAWGQEPGGTWLGARSGPGPRFGGAFLARLGGGQINGDAFFNECIKYGGSDSTCFQCSSFNTVPPSFRDRVCTRT